MMPVMRKCEQFSILIISFYDRLPRIAPATSFPSQVCTHASMLGAGAQGSTYLL